MPFSINIILAILLPIFSFLVLRYSLSPVYKNVIEKIEEESEKGEDAYLTLWAYRLSFFVFALSCVLAIAIFSLDKQSTSKNLEETTSKNLEETTEEMEKRYARAESELLIKGHWEESELTENDKEQAFAEWILLMSPISTVLFIILLRFIFSLSIFAKLYKDPDYHPIITLLFSLCILSYCIVLRAIYIAL